MENYPNIDGLVSNLVNRTESCSCNEYRLELPSLHNESDKMKLSFIGKILSNRSFSAMVVKEIVNKAWQLHFLVSVKKMDRNIFLFSFEHEADLNSVFRKRPWTLHGAHLVLKTWSPELTWKEVNFSTSTFCVQVHGLPFLWQNKSCLLRIGNKIGKVLEVDFIGEFQPRWSKYVRIRVEIEVSKPLWSGFFLPRKDLSDVWIGFKFERLPALCYKCGILGHESSGCNRVALVLTNPFSYLFPAYGHWLHTDNTEHPPGIYYTPHSSDAPTGVCDLTALPAALLQPNTSSDSSKTEVVLPLAMATPHDHLRQTAATVVEPIQDNPTSLTSLMPDPGLHEPVNGLFCLGVAAVGLLANSSASSDLGRCQDNCFHVGPSTLSTCLEPSILIVDLPKIQAHPSNPNSSPLSPLAENSNSSLLDLVSTLDTHPLITSCPESNSLAEPITIQNPHIAPETSLVTNEPLSLKSPTPKPQASLKRKSPLLSDLDIVTSVQDLELCNNLWNKRIKKSHEVPHRYDIPHISFQHDDLTVVSPISLLCDDESKFEEVGIKKPPPPEQ
jgi:hypothetical protein